MNVIMPFAELHLEAIEALDASGWAYQLVDVSDSDESYWSLIAGLWRDGETFALVEHDVIVRPDSLTELADCKHIWCSFPVPYMRGEHHGLSCVKFDAELLAHIPNALDRAGTWSNDLHPRKHWCTVDHSLQYVVLPSSGFYRHGHGPALGHLSTTPSHGCAS